MKNSINFIAVFLIFFVQVIDCNAQRRRDRRAANRAAQVAVAERIIVVPQWKRAYLEARSNLLECNSLPDSKVCKSIQYYKLGYLFEHTKDSANTGLLDSAAHYYSANLRLFPADRTTRDRLVAIYERQEKHEDAISLLKQLFNEYPGQRANYALQISNNYLRTQDLTNAFAWAKRCTSLDPHLEAGWKNLVESMTKVPISFNDVEALSYNALSYGFTNQSLQMIELYINSKYKTDNMDIPLIHWCNILFDAQSDYVSRFQKLPDYTEWPNQGFRQLKSLFEKNKEEKIQLEDMSQMDFWYNHERINSPDEPIFRYEILLKFLDQSASNWLYSNLNKSINRYEIGIEMVKDLHIQSYELTGTYFNFASSLANIYLNYPKLDPNNEKIDKLTNNLFSGKGFAYRDNNREIIKRFHITLGMIYAQQNKWKGRYRADNAKFQLEHALQNKEKDEYMPLVHELLGNGYLHYLGDKKRAFDHYISAAEGYLSMDALLNANKALDTLKKYAVNISPEIQQKTMALYGVSDIRDKGRDIHASGNTSKSFVENQVAKIMALPLDDSFKNMQTFKVYSELGQQMPEDENVQMFCYKNALDIAQKLDHVPSYNDLLKVEQISHVMQKQINTSVTSFTQLNKNTSSDTKETTSKRITYNAADGRQVTMFIDPGLFEVAEVLYISKQVQDVESKPEISYFNQQVIIQNKNNKYDFLQKSNKIEVTDSPMIKYRKSY